MKRNLMQLGRSMVEMLGVLAIIGVLSIVGIQGYKKAMNKHKANELMNLAMRVYNEALARSVVENGGEGYTVYLRATNFSASVQRNAGMEAPSWAQENFNIAAQLSNNNYHTIMFYYMTKDDCEALRPLTKKTASSYRLLSGNNLGMPDGIRVYCDELSSKDSSFWSGSDPN